ncbi:MAG: ATP-binding cassette domain-containing protein [Lachnospiraceae bacterium]|nr:ATP-binding cassette domain-containing protein [Lachnospiraceae bacterium]
MFAMGKIYGITGRNGSGKTVRLKCICGFLYPRQGR